MNQHPSIPALRRLLPWLGLLAAALLACGPFLSGGVWHGSDLGYHLRRIENIAMGLADGQFPVRIQSDWLLGNGYAVGVFYGDILPYFPAALRLLGGGRRGLRRRYGGGRHLPLLLAGGVAGGTLAAAMGMELQVQALADLGDAATN